MKKILSILAAALALTILASGLLTGCNANNSGSAANAGKNTARKIEITVDRLEIMRDKDLGFPGVFGNEFLLEENDAIHAHDPRIVPLPAKLDDCPSGVDCKPSWRRKNKNYSEFLGKFDDLYILCADISAKNAKCNEKVDAIRGEVKQLRKLSGEVRKSKKSGKSAYTKFNEDNKQLGKSVVKLNRDRNKIRMNAKRQKPSETAVDVESMTVRNAKLLNKVDNRLRLLEATHENLVKLNEEIRIILGKSAMKPADNAFQPQHPKQPQQPQHPQQPQTPRFRTLPYRTVG